MLSRSKFVAGPALQPTGLAIALTPRSFSSGAVGWYGGDKLTIDGIRFQVSASVVCHNSADWSAERKAAFLTVAKPTTIADIAYGELKPRSFGTGAVGYGQYGKATVQSETVQVSLTITAIHSKPGSTPNAKNPANFQQWAD